MNYYMGVACGMNGESRGAYRNGGRNLRERGHFEDRHRWEDNIKIYLKEIGWEGVDGNHVA
jgi:hypothetical protein